jgi:hypothetical protein
MRESSEGVLIEIDFYCMGTFRVCRVRDPISKVTIYEALTCGYADIRNLSDLGR